MRVVLVALLVAGLTGAGFGSTVGLAATATGTTVTCTASVLDAPATCTATVTQERRGRHGNGIALHARSGFVLGDLHAGAGATVYMTLELEEALGSGQLGGRAISSLADNVILLRHLEVKDRLERAVLVLKARGTAHESGVRHFTIDGSGPHVGGPFAAVR